ncbi:hypothetical protein BGX26_012889 [Mortierella sp. AD094]|nr:hypothetical protein BGX26_012889 [Mortierella sp. AD094]
MSDESYVLLGTPLPQTAKTDAFETSRGADVFMALSQEDSLQDIITLLGQKKLLSDAARLKTTGDFDTVGSSRQELEMKRAAARDMQASGGVLGALPDTLIDDLVVPSSEPVGIRLLKRMGWKPGQGIGPRVSRRQRKPEDGPLSDDDIDIPANVTFAPIDSAIVTFINKSNRQGLGYDPYKNAPEFDRSLQGRKESKYLTTQSGSKKTGFGFGTFDDDDDDDVYGSGPATLHTLDTDLDMDEGSYSRRKSKPENPDSLKSDTLPPMHCSDGRPPLRGFVLASMPLKPVKWYAAPKVPRDFDPHHIFHDDIKPIHPASRREQPKLTADDRALVLGETPIDAPRRSVFEYISAENKNRLDNILGFVMDVEGEKRLKKDHWEVPKIEKSAAEAALMGFIPFSDNVAKQNRYKQYLNVQAGISDEKIELVEGFSGEDMTKELNEFVQAARIFKPLSSSMANRFTTATKVIEFAKPTAGLRSAEDIKTSEKTTPKPSMVEKMEIPVGVLKSQAAKAAAMGMFGPLTRTVVEFYPSKLLCKRFNVPNPHPAHKDSGPETAKDLLDKKTMDAMMVNRAPGGGMSTDDIALGNPQESSPPDTQDLTGNVEIEPAKSEPEDEVQQERPSMDIFKAIFDDSDSDSDIDSDSGSESNGKKLTSVPVRDASSSDVDPGAAIIKTESEKMEIDPELEPSGPFRPMFTKKSERPGAHSLTSTRVQNRSNKLDFSHLNEDNEYEEDEMGPKITLKKPKLKSNVAKDPSSAAKRSFDEVYDNVSGSEAALPARPRSESPDDFIGPPMPDKIDLEKPASSLRNEDSHSSKRVKSSSPTTHRTSSHKDSSSSHKESSSSHKESSSSHKVSSSSHRGSSSSQKESSSSQKESSSSSSRHKSSSSRPERDERSHSSSSRSRHRSTSKTRRRSKSENLDNGADYGSEGDSGGDRSDTSKDGEKRRRRSELTSASSRSKSRRHREYRSRSRSKSPSRSNREDRDREKDRDRDREKDRDRDRDKDRDKDRDRDRVNEKDRDKEKDRRRRRDHDRDSERSSKRSKPDKHKSKHHHRDRDRDEESDMEGLWVEKNTEGSSSAPPTLLEPPTSPIQPVNRIRASDFF